ncbi:MAG: TonB-dependent receptor [Gemmatimonadales bacterium]
MTTGSIRFAVVLLTLAPAGPAVGAQERDSTSAPRRTTLTDLTVTASRTDQTVRSVPANVVVLTRAATALSAAKAVPDLLRVLPGFGTRDFQSQLSAHPSRSAAAFRGLGTTSSSRALVLLDGVPMNEPFAGWVHWARVPLSLLQRIEAVRGGGAGVWGSRSLGGVINLITVDPPRSQLELATEAGSFGTVRGSATGSLRSGKLRVLAAGDYFDTDGYVVVGSDVAGPIDRPSFQETRSGFLRAIYDASPGLQLQLGGSYLDQFSNTGTPLNGTNVEVGELRGSVRWVSPGGGVLQLAAHGSRTRMDLFNTSQSSDRTTETPSLSQFDVPSNAVGVGLQWSQVVARRHQFTTGIDGSRVDGEVNEDQRYVQGAFTRRRRVVGEQANVGAYLQDAVDLGRGWRLLTSARFDRFRNRDASRLETDIQSGAVLLDTLFTGSDESRFSFSVGGTRQVSSTVSLRASGYGSFRAPTLNELYKPAREGGNVLIESNAALVSERLFGIEAGGDFQLNPDVVLRLTAFLSRVSDPIIDATIGVTGSTGATIAPCGFVPANGTCRQRGNAGSLRTAGLESEIELYPHRDLSIWAAYTFNPTRISAPADQEELDGKQSRSAARHTVSAIVSYQNPRVLSLSFTGRYVGARFDDDLNTLRLDPFLVLDARAERRLLKRASLQLKVENLFDKEYRVNRTAGGFSRRGMPRFATAGLAVRW